MTYRLLADDGCPDGNCPRFEIDDESADVIVRGYSLDDPTRELDVRIPAASWTRLISQLPQ